MEGSGGRVEAEWRHFTDVVEAVEAVSENFQNKSRMRGEAWDRPPGVGNVEKTYGHNAKVPPLPPLPPLPPQNPVSVEWFSGGAPAGLRCVKGMPCAIRYCPELASWWLADPRFEVTGGAWVCLHHFQNGQAQTDQTHPPE